ncbi:uncharacterized protein ELE39_002895 [Cryptosporidium sp. chipmunk genotype I]|uniref:uncharacterized protein n=1 Tax=Cryptosporidium sp. chipmunk genotype I TaxID=1280935 RepID=UPI00351A95F4|nr:hypothetical protein ELE39_002895 [Cryptosporidium sp. chipmunk genotype I]
MDQENTKSLNAMASTPIRNGNLSSKNVNLETPNKGLSRRSIGSAGGSSSVRRSSRLLKKSDEKSADTKTLTPQLGAPGGTPYLLRSKSRETLSSAEANLRRNAMAMPPLNLISTNDLEGSSEFYQTNMVTNDENSNKVEDLSNIYSTPRKRVRGAENSYNNNNNAELDLDRDLGSGSQIRNSSRRKGGNIKNTPVSRRVNEEDSGIKDRKSILKQYDPDSINTSTMNIKTPKSQKKVQFGTKNLIIIDENKQDMNINKSIAESDNDESSNIQDNRSMEDLTVGRMSILSELDDAGTGQIYNFPSLEELINTKKSEGNSVSKVYSSDIVGSEVSDRFRNANSNNNIYYHHGNNQDNKVGNPDEAFVQNEHSGKNKSKTDQDGIIHGKNTENLHNEYIKENQIQVQDESSIEKNIELTDQINISDYSINCRDSIAPNLPGAFLSVVMKNLSSVNFPEETKPESEDDIKIPGLELNDENLEDKEFRSVEDSINRENDLDKDGNIEERKIDQEMIIENQFVIEDHGNYTEEEKEEIKVEENKVVQNQQKQGQFESVNEEKKMEEKLVREERKDFSILEIATEKESNSKKNHSEENLNTQNDNFETQQIVLTETLTLKDNNNRFQNILVTPKKNNSNVGYINKLSPSSESLLKSLNNTKSILNITPQGYTWEEFQSILNLNYTMENYFGILEFDEIENNHLIKDKNIEEESMDSKLLLIQLQNILKEDGGNHEKIQKIVAKYSSEIIKSIKYQIWDEIEKNTLIKEFNDEYHERYSENLSKFSTSEIATLMAIIVNKSRYGSKNDERIRNELFERISGYFFGEGRNIFLKKAIINWKEKVVFPLKNSIINKFEEMIKVFMLKHEQIINNKNRIQNSNVLLSTLESCKISEMHVYETYWNAMRIVHENIANYKEEIERVKNYLNMMDKKKRNISRLLSKEEELYYSLVMELNDWRVKKNSLRNHLNDLRIKEEFAGFTWDLFTLNKFQTIIILNNNCNNQSNLIKVRVSIEWNIDDHNKLIMNTDETMDNPPIILKIELLLDNVVLDNNLSEDASSINSKYNDLQLHLALVNNQRLEDKIYNAYIEIIEKTLNLRLMELYLDYKKRNKMNNNILIELIRGIFQSCIVLLWRLESIVFEILNTIKVFNLAIIDIIDENKLIINIPILVGINGKNDIEIYNSRNENQSSNFINSLVTTYSSCNSNSPVTSPSILPGNSKLILPSSASSSSPITPSSLTSNSLSPHLLMASRPVITITFNITNSLFMSVGTLVNSIEDISVYNMSDEIAKDMICVFKDQINIIEGRDNINNNNHIKKNSAVYVGYNCLLSVIQNTIQEGGRNQLIWKRPLEKFAPRLLNAVQISKIHQNF